HIPLAVLAGVLVFVAWNMGEWREFGRLRQFSSHYRLMLLSTFFVTIVFDLTVAVELGLVLAVVLFVRRQSDLFRAEPTAHTADSVTITLYGALFFGAVSKVDALVEQVRTLPPGGRLVLDARMLTSLDTTGLDALEQLLKALDKQQAHLCVTGLQPQPRSLMERSGFIGHLHSVD
ncbi:MAG: STAS domain-containing protein, partial [Burkholderiaceae bacterium]|nr:STAS domain-containing protein [Burkholderiaceae bacterium]